MIFPSLSWVLLLIALALCSVGFYKMSFFTTVGHGLAAAGLGVGILAIAFSRGQSSPVLVASGVLCLVYGWYQGIGMGIAEWLKVSRRRVLKSVREEETPLYVSIVMWLGMALGSCLQISPLWYRVADGVGKDKIFSWIGLVLMIFGLLVIILAGYQGARQQREEPSMPPVHGLYNWVRCPVQLGRIVFWLGVLIGGAGFLSGAQWIVALLGFVTALALSLRSAFRQDAQSRRRYRHLPEYREYVEDTHILIPLLMSKPITWDKEEE